jgi:hypothetical protein
MASEGFFLWGLIALTVFSDYNGSCGSLVKKIVYLLVHCLFTSAFCSCKLVPFKVVKLISSSICAATSLDHEFHTNIVIDYSYWPSENNFSIEIVANDGLLGETLPFWRRNDVNWC